ncbi:MAG: MobA/MobL family protein [Veillonella sp.]|nr:MobA/MobL family protein [Veillonella sp.]
MAIYHLHVHMGKRGEARTYFDYLQAIGAYEFDERLDRVLYSQSCHLPSWAHSPRDFWGEEYFKLDGFRVIEVALPYEFELEDSISCVESFVEMSLDGYALSYVIHETKGYPNPHAHIMFSERKIDVNRAEPDRDNWFKKSRTRKDGSVSGGYAKDFKIVKGAGRKQWLLDIRESWEDCVNEILASISCDARVSSQSNEVQGLDVKPQFHVGSGASRMELKRSRLWENEMIAAENELLYDDDIVGDFLEGQVDDEILYLEEALLETSI